MEQQTVSPRDFGRVEQKLDNVAVTLAQINARLDRRDATVDGKIEKVSDRVSKIEQRMWTWGGATAVLVWIAAKVNLSTLFSAIK